MPQNAISLGDRLVLFHYFNHLFGAKTFQELQQALRGIPPGYDAEGRSHFFNALKGRTPISEDRLAKYDANLRVDVDAINRKRPNPVQLKYFQYLAALYTEIFLDRRANDEERLLNDLNQFVLSLDNLAPGSRPHFGRDDLKKVAYWMATGSGKTLLLHLNYRQFLRYHPDPGDNLLLITPNEGLSAQHLEEMRLSSVPARPFLSGATIADHPHTVQVIEITKITENKSGGGVSVDVDAFEGRNLLFVDEGHKGSGGEAWMGLRAKMGAEGFTFEYSATFGQAINPTRDTALLEEYSKAILFDYSYKYFHGDGYGKEYQVLNLREDRADELTETFLLANLLAFYEQTRLYQDHKTSLKPYHLEAPLWIFVGKSVNAVYSENREKKSDVLRVILLLDKILRNPEGWTVAGITHILNGDVELRDEGGRDLFAGRFRFLRARGWSPQDLYQGILQIFYRTQTPSSLHLHDLKGAEGEIALKAGNAEHYFGLINIGDTNEFFKLVDKEPALTRADDEFTGSLFDRINNSGSPVNVLIGAKKFIEGWSSWRVSTMGLFNIGQSEGTEIIQLFGRGVRLLGKDRSLKRSWFLPGPHPEHLEYLETLHIFGVRANYMAQFRDYLEREGISPGGYEEIEIPIQTNGAFLERGLVVPRLRAGADFKTIPLTLPAPGPDAPTPRLDLRPQVNVLTGQLPAGTHIGVTDSPRVIAPNILPFLDWDCLYLDMLEFKCVRGWHNLALPRETLLAVLENQQYSLYALDADVRPQSFAGLMRVQKTALAILEKYAETYYQRERRRWESRQMEYRLLDQEDPNLAFGKYTLSIPLNQQELTQNIHQLLLDADRLYHRDDDTYLPRVHFDRHLYQPLLAVINEVDISPAPLNDSEQKFVRNLREWLKSRPDKIAGKDIFLLRNQTRGRGIGFFEDVGFYPDFILWVKQGDQQRLCFIDPHGMQIGSGPQQDKVQLFQTIKELQSQLNDPNVILDSYIISATDFGNLSRHPAWPTQKTRQDFADLHVLFEDSDLGFLFA